jgi:hypothetical protein
MPSFTKDALRTPFGRNQYLRSTRDMKLESYTVYAASVPNIAIDTVNQKVLQPGTVMAKIVSGAGLGMIGPFQAGGPTNERVQIAVDATGGTYTITFSGGTTAAIAFNAPAAAVKSALVLGTPLGVNDVLVTGGPGSAGAATPYILEFVGDYGGQDVPAVTTTPTLTGGATTAAVTVPTAGSSGATGGATDGRENPDNIVGFCNTFLPWQLSERDVEIAVLYEGAVVQAWCLQLNGGGTAYAVISQATANAMRNGPACSILFK